MMMTTKRMLRAASQNGYAVGAFNVENAEMLQAVLAAAEEMEAPVIIQTTPGTLRYLPPEYFAGMLREKGAGAPVALHLDHGSSFELAVRCMEAGYTSVMIDGSALPYEENIRLTARVCASAQDHGIPVEAELGKVGGKEDDLECSDAQYTDPDQAADFVRRTGVDSLAVAIGTAHGFYKVEPRLDLDRIIRIREKVDVPLVMHGASGVPDEKVRRAVENGMAKVNFATELRAAFSQGVKEYLEKDHGVYDPKKYLSSGAQKVRELVKEKICLCGSQGKARDLMAQVE